MFIIPRWPGFEPRHGKVCLVLVFFIIISIMTESFFFDRMNYDWVLFFANEVLKAKHNFNQSH